LHEYFNYILILHLQSTYSAHVKDLPTKKATIKPSETHSSCWMYHKKMTCNRYNQSIPDSCMELQLLQKSMMHTPNAACNVSVSYRVLNTPPCLAGAGPQLPDEDAMCDNFTLYDVYQSEAHH